MEELEKAHYCSCSYNIFTMQKLDSLEIMQILITEALEKQLRIKIIDNNLEWRLLLSLILIPNLFYKWQYKINYT